MWISIVRPLACPAHTSRSITSRRSKRPLFRANSVRRPNSFGVRFRWLPSSAAMNSAGSMLRGPASRGAVSNGPLQVDAPFPESSFSGLLTSRTLEVLCFGALSRLLQPSKNDVSNLGARRTLLRRSLRFLRLRGCAAANDRGRPDTSPLPPRNGSDTATKQALATVRRSMSCISTASEEGLWSSK